eukprot:1393054-Prymnesium_polylepis.1
MCIRDRAYTKSSDIKSSAHMSTAIESSNFSDTTIDIKSTGTELSAQAAARSGCGALWQPWRARLGASVGRLVRVVGRDEAPVLSGRKGGISGEQGGISGEQGGISGEQGGL